MVVFRSLIYSALNRHFYLSIVRFMDFPRIKISRIQTEEEKREEMSSSSSSSGGSSSRASQKADTKSVVLQSVLDANCPLSVGDVCERIGKEHAKQAVQKALDQLVTEKSINERVFGKSKVFFAVEGSAPGQQEEQKSIENRIVILKSEIRTKERRLAELKAQMESNKGISMSGLEEDNEKLGRMVEDLKSKIKSRSSASQDPKAGTSADAKKTQENYNRLIRAYYKRKRIARTIIDHIMDTYPNSQKKLYDEVGIQIDEPAGFRPPPPV